MLKERTRKNSPIDGNYADDEDNEDEDETEDIDYVDDNSSGQSPVDRNRFNSTVLEPSFMVSSSGRLTASPTGTSRLS